MNLMLEGLQHGDLKDMVLPMLSIDEFSSKIDDNKIIVVGFYCFEEDPAHDLSNFCERSPVNVEDTDVSPAPSKEGYYLTFVEMLRTPQFPERLMQLLKEVSQLTDIQNWQFTSIKLSKGKVLELTEENVRKWVDIKPKAESTQQKVQEWFQHSSLSDVRVQGDHVSLVREGIIWNMNLINITSDVPQVVIQLDEASNSQALRLERLLEGGYKVHVCADCVVMEHPQESTYLIAQLDLG